MRPWTNKSVSFGIAGIVLVAIGVFFCFFWHLIFRQILQKGLALTPDSKSFEVWKDTSSLPPMHLNIYFFNWTNPEELKVPGSKPILQQVGPYSFVEMKKKVDVTFNPKNKTVSYMQQRTWFFDAEASNGSLSDNITQLNVVALSASHKVRYWSYVMQTTLSYVLLHSSSHIYTVKTVDELLFAGYDDPLIKMGKAVTEGDDVPPFDRFGWFFGRNETSHFDGQFNMNTGEDDISKLGVMRKWNFKDTTKFYGPPCNLVEGSAGELWPPGRTKEDIRLFSVDLCRSLIYEYERETMHHGIEGYHYALGAKSLRNDTQLRYPHDQARFWQFPTTTEDFFVAEHSAESTDTPGKEDIVQDYDEDTDIVPVGECLCGGECSPVGLVNVTACRYGAPVFVSLPHFYLGDPVLKNGVVGLNPNEKDHSFSITLEPTTGMPLEVNARLQVNLLLQPSKSISLYKEVPKIYFPVFWFSMHVHVTPEMASELKILLSLPNILVYGGIITLTIGSFITFTVGLLHVMRKPQEKTPASQNGKMLEAIPDKKSELVFLDKVSANEDAHVRSDRRLYPKLY